MQGHVTRDIENVLPFVAHFDQWFWDYFSHDRQALWAPECTRLPHLQHEQWETGDYCAHFCECKVWDQEWLKYHFDNIASDPYFDTEVLEWCVTPSYQLPDWRSEDGYFSDYQEEAE